MQHNGDHAAARYFYLHDRLSSVRQIINQSGSVVNSYTYDPYGMAISGETSKSVSNLYRFAGYVWDAEPQEYYCFNRQYDPITE